MQGTDNGEFKSIREQFLDKIELLPNTKRPPEIIHSTIARFQKEQELQPIVDFIAREELAFEQVVSSFRLVREAVIPQLEHELIKNYPL